MHDQYLNENQALDEINSQQFISLQMQTTSSNENAKSCLFVLSVLISLRKSYKEKNMRYERKC